MKTLLTLLLAVICLGASAQDLKLDTINKQVSYNGVVETPGTKDELYVRARSWFASSFKNSNYVLQMDDKEAGKLIGKGSALGNIRDALNITTLGTFKLNYTIYITVKDGKYRYEITDFNSEDLPGQNIYVINKYNIYDLAINPSNRKSNGKWKGKNSTYILLAYKTATELEQSILSGMRQSIVNRDNF